MEKFKFAASVNLFLIKDGKILLGKRKNTHFYPGHYEGPAGGMDGGETVREAMAREAKEEVNIDIKVEDLEVVHVIHRKSEFGEYFEFYLLAKAWEGEPVNAEPERCEELSWFPLDSLPEPMVPKTKFAIEQWHKGEVFSECDWV